MKREIITTADGSKTIYLEDLNEYYHSKHGAIQEAYHVFVKNGLHHFIETSENKTISILELGFGTGLNAFITFWEVVKNNWTVDYIGIEAYPVSLAEVGHLNYSNFISDNQS
ncbi:MAG: SAM-dependent methyltransferase, partial [Flavobacteriaceae bacterium]|nr:SAM-dependent methyltransferase [Flavobacteriaceae bacterium]